MEHREISRQLAAGRFKVTRGHGDAEVDENYKSQNPNNKQLTMTKIQNSKPSHHLKRIQICLGH
jgi:hypothetical protein